MSKAWSQGSTRASRKKRALVLARDGYRCMLKIEGICTTIATQEHHVLGKGVSEDPNDSIASCRACNLHVGDPRKYDPPAGPARTQW